MLEKKSMTYFTLICLISETCIYLYNLRLHAKQVTKCGTRIGYPNWRVGAFLKRSYSRSNKPIPTNTIHFLKGISKSNLLNKWSTIFWLANRKVKNYKDNAITIKIGQNLHASNRKLTIIPNTIDGLSKSSFIGTKKYIFIFI